MTDDDTLLKLLRSAVPPTVDERPARDLWPTIARGPRARGRWSWVDVGVAAGVGIALTMVPAWFWVLAYHL